MKKHDFSMSNLNSKSTDFPQWVLGLGAWLRLNLGEKSMVLGRQRELSGQPVIKFNRNHPETSFLGL